MMKITNKTINKLTAEELNNMGCLSNFGIITLSGTPKKVVKGYTRGAAYTAEGDICYFVFYKIASNYEIHLVKILDGWAYRVFNLTKKEYSIEDAHVCNAVTFVKN